VILIILIVFNVYHGNLLELVTAPSVRRSWSALWPYLLKALLDWSSHPASSLWQSLKQNLACFCSYKESQRLLNAVNVALGFYEFFTIGVLEVEV